MNRFYSWLGVAALLLQIPLMIIVFMNDLYVGACYLALLILYVIELWTNAKLHLEKETIYLEGMIDGISFHEEVNERVSSGEEPKAAADEAFKRYKRKIN